MSGRRCRAVRSQGPALHKAPPGSRYSGAPHRALWERTNETFPSASWPRWRSPRCSRMVVADADARPRASAGSRGSKTYSAPPPTATAPNAAAPINRTMTQPGAPGVATAAARPPVAQPGGMFGGARGMLGGLAAGLLGAGLIGMLMGNGFLGGLAGFASIFGLLLQVALIGGVGFLLYRWWQRRSQPQPAYAGMPRADDRGAAAALGARRLRGFGGGARAGAGRRAARDQGRGLRHVRAPARRSPDRLWARGSRRAALSTSRRRCCPTTPRNFRRMRAAASSTRSAT